MQSLWIGARLSAMERLSIASFLANGHAFHLYAYEDIEGVPAGTEMMDAARVLPASKIFRSRENGSLAGFANFFRYKLLLERGGWWVDLDTVCLRPFDFDGEYVISSELHHSGSEVVDLAALKTPPGSALAEYAWRVCQAKDPGQIRWGETGPRLLAEAVRQCGLERYIQPPRAFCPVNYRDWASVLDGSCAEPGADSYGIHLWNELWRDSGQDKDAAYPADCLFERLKARYLGSNR